MAGEPDLVLPQREPLARGDLQLLLDQVYAGDLLRNRVFDLYPGVHFYKVKGLVFVHQELDGPRVRVVHLLRQTHGGAGDRLSRFRI